MKNKKFLWLAVLLFAAALLCAGKGIMSWREMQDAGKEYESMQAELAEKSTQEETEAVSETEPPEVTEPVEIPIDFASLQEENPDIYAWIEIPGTDINYPVLQHATDNGYYLNHTPEGVSAVQGSIYTENYNSKDFEDLNTVIYGHNMKNGSMFKPLLRYEDEDFFNDNREVIIYMPDQIRHYEIFAAYTYDNRHLLFSVNYEDEDSYKEYLEEILSNRDYGALIDRDEELDTTSKILTLSTCVNSGADNERFLVQAVLVSIEK